MILQAAMGAGIGILVFGDSVQQTCKVHDFIKAGPFDIEANFIKNTFRVTDLKIIMHQGNQNMRCTDKRKWNPATENLSEEITNSTRHLMKARLNSGILPGNYGMSISWKSSIGIFSTKIEKIKIC